MATTTTTGSVPLAGSRTVSYAVTSPSSAGEHRFILLSSPLCTTITIWDPVVLQLTALGFSIIRYDLPGHGLSGAPANLSSTTLESLAQDVHDLLTHLNIQKLHAWIGVSLGAATSMVFTSKHPGVVERLIPCCTISCSPTKAGTADIFSPRIAAARKVGNMNAAIDETMDRWFGRAWLDSHPDEAERARKAMLGTSIDGFETCCAALRNPNFDLEPLVATAGSHVDSALLLVGEKEESVIASMDLLRQGIEAGLRSKGDKTASVRLEVVRNAGHVPFVDNFETFVDLITKFVR